MQIDLGEKDIIYILNCINIVERLLIYHKVDYDFYFNKINYEEDLSNLQFIHKRISLNSNEFFYNRSNDFYFIGQMQYFRNKERNFEFLKKNEDTKKTSIFKFTLDKLFKVV